MRLLCIVLLFLLLSLSITPLAIADLKVGFYNSSCPRAESIVSSVISNHFNADPSVTAAFLRMYFHDCFVRGCDASILIAPTKKKKTERSAGPNQTVRGFEIVDEAKANLEAQCPATLSCADIIAIATRDAVALAGGPSYDVPTGRRDGLVSNPNDVSLPGPTLTVSQAFQFFSAKGFALEEMVILLGGHTVGVAHCSFFSDRLSNFQGTGAPDPSMDPSLRAKLAQICGTKPSKKKDPTAFLDRNTSFAVDNQYYNQLLLNKGVMQIDQELASDSSTSSFVSGLAADEAGFLQKFADALVKLGSVDVLVGSAGNIRKNCSVFN